MIRDIEQRRVALVTLVNRYNKYKLEGRLDLTSEETIRTWLNEMLSIFGWDVQDTSQILQEKTLTKVEKERLKIIDSTHTQPDYTFKLGKEKLTFLDAKDITVDLNTDKNAAFQIKAYGWSISAPCAFISNFEQFAIYDCGYQPEKGQAANIGRSIFSISEYIENFELLDDHLYKPNIYNGQLEKIYSDAQVDGLRRISIDFSFADLLSTFRLNLAKNILKNNNEAISNNNSLLSYIVQVIINRILFIRVCEARKLEEKQLLIYFQKQGFWEEFKKSSYLDFYHHYDGSLFERVDVINNLIIDNEVFNGLLSYLYYPSPYRFDVIPTKLLSDIYEIFLSKKLILNEGVVLDTFKTEYIKSKGAVTTPQFLVDDIIKRTLLKQKLINSGIEGVLNISALDICCGSGVFLIGLYDYLESIIIEIQKTSRSESYSSLFTQTESGLALNLKGKQAILNNCIYGIDIDPEAVEVARMSLALKVIDNEGSPEDFTKIGLFSEQILNGIGLNIVCGNSLVDELVYKEYPEILDDDKQLFKTNAFDWNNEVQFMKVFENKKGFDFIVGNPPYVEVKHFNKEMPYMHSFIKDKYTTADNGKIDLAVPFIEKGLSVLNGNGRLGFIVQKRQFKTNYGSKIRNFLVDNHYLSSFVDFSSTSIFKGRLTYVATLILDKSGHENFYYHLIKDRIKSIPTYLKDLPVPEISSAEYEVIPTYNLKDTEWAFDCFDIRNKLLLNGKFGDYVTIKGGPQALKNAAYHIKVKDFRDDIIIGSSQWLDNIEIEIDACRPLFCNENFYAFRPITTNTYVIFPYDIEDGKKRNIPYDEFCERFPLAGAYLKGQKARLEGPKGKAGGVETMPMKYPEKYTANFWHLYTRPNNLTNISSKVFIPMTALDTFATVSNSERIYADNANMWFVELPVSSEEKLYAVAAIINSILFSVLARSIANPQDGGYFKFNKQFLEPVPFPVENFNNSPELITQLAGISKDIEKRQGQYKESPNNRTILNSILRQLWNQLDSLVYSLYDLSDDQIRFFNKRGRNINRVESLK